MGPLRRQGRAFLVRQRGDRHLRTADGRQMTASALAAEMKASAVKRAWWGQTASVAVRLPEEPDSEGLLVAHWASGEREPLILLVSPAARRPGRTAWWFARAYRRRWGVEDATRGIQQQFDLEAFLVRSWSGIQRLLWLVAAFLWLNQWGEPSYDRLREWWLSHPWRLPQRITYLFDAIAMMIRYLLRPTPRFADSFNNSG